MLSQKARYGLKAMIYLAKKYPEEKYVIVSELSKADYIPRKFLEKILLQLKQQDFLESKIGRSGGYRLKVPPKDIFLSDLLSHLGEHLEPLPCLRSPNSNACWDCGHRPSCEIRNLMSKVYETIFSMFNSISLCHFIENDSPEFENVLLKFA